MTLTRVLTIVGTRPEAIKMAPVIGELRRRPEFVVRVCSTGQHRELLEPVWRLFGIHVDHELDVMTPNQDLNRLLGVLLERLDGELAEYPPDWVLAQGDTTTVVAAALAAFHRQMRFGHVEAGLRSYDRQQPFPEEIYRRVADLVADLYFCPTETAQQNLLAEGVPAGRVLVTGNTVVDALLEVVRRPYDWEASALARTLPFAKLVLVTAHRRENFGEPLARIFAAVRRLAAEFRDQGVAFVYPVHPNPQVREPAERMLGGLPNVVLVEPLAYDTMAQLLKRCWFVLTDSGGLQEEAPSLGVPVLVMREKTERPEGLASGAVKLVGTAGEQLLAEGRRLLSDPQARSAMTGQRNPFGDGRAACRIVDRLLEDARRSGDRGTFTGA